MTREKFRVPPPDENANTDVHNNPGRVDPPNPPQSCPTCGSAMKKSAGCCSTTYRCSTYPVCKYREDYDKQGVRR